MIVNKQILSIPPVLTTTWANIDAVRKSPEGAIVIQLIDGASVSLPDIGAELEKQIFATFEEHLIQSSTQEVEKPNDMILKGLGDLFGGQEGSLPLPLQGLQSQIMGFMEHDQSQASAPDLPPLMLTQVLDMAKRSGLLESAQIPKGEPHCNCPFCQIAKALNQIQEEVSEEPEVLDEELTFREWDIEELGEQVFLVRDASEPTDEYKVCIGEQTGCTCGKENCDHIAAVLRS